MSLLVHILAYSGFRVVIQAFGFIYLKKSRDPLEGIQSLEFMTLVSNVQKPTTLGLPKVVEENWSDLDTD